MCNDASEYVIIATFWLNMLCVLHVGENITLQLLKCRESEDFLTLVRQIVWIKILATYAHSQSNIASYTVL